jgi:hypothetical protein
VHLFTSKITCIIVFFQISYINTGIYPDQQFFAPLCQLFKGVHAILCTIFVYCRSYLWIFAALVKELDAFWYSNLLYFLAWYIICENLIGYWFITCFITIYACNFKLHQWWIAQSWKKDVRGRWGQYMFHPRDKSVTNQILANDVPMK